MIYNLNNFPKGWVIGHFPEAIIHSETTEVAIKRYKAGESEEYHMHKLADEITIIVSGSAKMNGLIFRENEIILVRKGEYTNFEAITDVTTCVIKSPSVKDDKYFV